MSFKDFKDRWKHVPTDVIGMDIGRAAVKMVRLRKNGASIALMGTELGPGFAFDGSTPSITIPPRLQARYVSLAISDSRSTAKLLTFPGSVNAAFEADLAKNLGLDPATDDRMAYRVVTEAAGRGDSRVLAASVPEAVVAPVMRIFASGLPAPRSLELSPVAALTAFEATAALAGGGTAGLLDFGTESSMLSIFHRKTLVMIRRFDFGIRKLLDRVTSSLHIDIDTALNILSDDAFDISELIADIMGPFSSQLIVSRDFAERRENCSLKHLHIIGGIASSQAAMHELERSLHLSIERFDPFSVPSLQPDAPEALPATDRWRYTAALGAALATLQEAP